MNRSRKIALLAHCLLNVNSKVEGLASYEAVHPLATELARRGYGLLQLPCPEFTAMGLKRWCQTFEQYDNSFFGTHCSQLADQIEAQVMEYLRCGYLVGPLIGIEGSPSCGVLERISGDWGGRLAANGMDASRTPSRRVAGSGVFIRELRKRLEPLNVTFVALDERDPEQSARRVLEACS